MAERKSGVSRVNREMLNDDFRLAVQRAPRAKALDGAILVDLAFIRPGLTDPLWWPLRDVLKGYLP
jgi:hypothetical protein